MRAASGTRLLGVMASVLYHVAAHPLCYFDNRPTDPDMTLTFCPAQKDGACCNDVEEAAIRKIFDAEGSLTGSCADYYKEVRWGSLEVTGWIEKLQYQRNRDVYIPYPVLLLLATPFGRSACTCIVAMCSFRPPLRQRGTKGWAEQHSYASDGCSCHVT